MKGLVEQTSDVAVVGKKDGLPVGDVIGDADGGKEVGWTVGGFDGGKVVGGEVGGFDGGKVAVGGDVGLSVATNSRVMVEVGVFVVAVTFDGEDVGCSGHGKN